MFWPFSGEGKKEVNEAREERKGVQPPEWGGAPFPPRGDNLKVRKGVKFAREKKESMISVSTEPPDSEPDREKKKDQIGAAEKGHRYRTSENAVLLLK